VKKWICPVCGKENENAEICFQCGFDESRNYGRYPSVCQLPPNVKANHEARLSQRLSDNNSIHKKTNELKPAPKTNDTLPEQEKDAEKAKPKLPSNYIKWLIAAACVIFVFGCGWLVHSRSASDKPEPESSESAQETTVPTSGTADPARTESESEQWRKNVLMSDVVDISGDYVANESSVGTSLGSDIGREEIVTITFLDTLDNMGTNARDVSAKGDGSVMAWLESVEEGYDLYIGAEGGLSANSESSGLFCGYRNLRNINFNDSFHTDYVTNMSWIFYCCSSLTELDLGSFRTENTTNMVGMFAGCRNLTELNISSFRTENVTSMAWMFGDCPMTKLNLSNFRTENVTDMSSMFRGCSGLKKLDLSSFCTKNVTNMVQMFAACSNLAELNLSNFRTENVTDMSWMFGGCSNLAELNLSSFLTENVTDMSSMFWGCSGLTKLDLSSFCTENVTDMSEMFAYCSHLPELNLSGFHTENVLDMSSILRNCSNLTELDLSSFHTENVKSMNSMFQCCSSLQYLDLSNFNTEKVLYMKNMFHDCTSLTAIDGLAIPEGADTEGMYDGTIFDTN